MNKLIIFFTIIFLLGCGNNNNTKTSNNSSYLKYMWNLFPDNLYVNSGEADKNAVIHIENSWKKTQGENIYVAVIDDCYDANHEDLKDNIYLTYNANTKSSNVNGLNCHGTEVSSVIGAVDNNYGIVGVAPKVKLILISIDLENSYEDVFLEAFDYAKEHGAKVINCSWGSGHESQIMHEKLQELKENNITVVFASGNDDEDLDNFFINDESEDPNVIGVGASSEFNDVTTYSSYGSNIDILAPAGEYIGVMAAKDNNDYEDVKGTSFSSPTVAGVVAMMYSLHPDLTFDEIYEKIINNADKIGINDGAQYIYGFDRYRAYGKINVDKIFKSLGDIQ